MNSVKPIVLLVLVGTAVFILTSALYAVSEIEQVIITQFGRPVGAAVTTAGLKLKVPFIQEVNRIDKRILEWDGSPTDMPTEDKLYISVDLFARWRIKDPLQYFSSTFCGCGMNAVPSPAWTTSSAARPAMRWRSTS